MTDANTTATDTAPADESAINREIECLEERIAELRAEANAIESAARARMNAARQ